MADVSKNLGPVSRGFPRIFVKVSLIHRPRGRVNTRRGIKARYANDLSWSPPTLLTPTSRIIPRSNVSSTLLSSPLLPSLHLLSSFVRVILRSPKRGSEETLGRRRYSWPWSRCNRERERERDTAEFFTTTREIKAVERIPFSSFALLKSPCLVNTFQLSS